MKMFIGAIGLLIASTLPADSLTITNDIGGWVPPYQKKFRSVAKRGERVIIDGPCLSACTLALTYIPNNRICVTPRAVLGFHRFTHDVAGRYDNQAMTQHVIQGYPQPVRAWIAQRGGYAAMPSQGFWTLQGPELMRILKPC